MENAVLQPHSGFVNVYSNSHCTVISIFKPARKNNRQTCIRIQNKSANIATTQPQEISSADEIKKYKELLDSGIITQEEFDLKKKQLLGL